MKIEEIIETYGKNDYYEMSTGRIFKLSEMSYNPFLDITNIPVFENGEFIGFINLMGDYVNEIMA